MTTWEVGSCLRAVVQPLNETERTGGNPHSDGLHLMLVLATCVANCWEF